MQNDEVVFHVFKNSTMQRHLFMQYTVKLQVYFAFFFLPELFNFESTSLQQPEVFHPDTS